MRCAACDGELDPSALEGLCPVCLISAALPEHATPADGAFRYDLVQEIARGGMGVVYRAVQHGSRRQVAIKMLLAADRATPELIARFRAEAEAVATLEHPNILPIYEVGEHDTRPFFSMKFADRGTLHEAIGTFRRDFRGIASLVATIARAVHYAHERGILHRDLKPGNVLLDGAAHHPYIADFGLAKSLQHNNALTIMPTALGTPNYMSPEQAAGTSAGLTTATDVYSLGAILYELLAQRVPFSGESALETLRLVEHTLAVPPRAIDPAVPRDLEVICLKCLAKEPSARYASAAALAEDLERWLDQRTILARPASKPERLWRWMKRNPAIAALWISLAILVIAVAVGSPVAAIRIARSRDRALAAENDATEKLLRSYIDQARAERLAGHRFDSLTALENATHIRASRIARDETIAALALLDLRPAVRWPRPGSTLDAAFDATAELYVIQEQPGILSVRRTADHKEVARLRGPAAPIGLVHGFSNDRRYLAAKSTDTITWVWEVASGRVVLRVAGQELWTNGDVAFSPNGKFLAFTPREGGIAFYNLADAPPDREIDAAKPWLVWADAPVSHRLAFDPTGEKLGFVDVSVGPRELGRDGTFEVRHFPDGAKLFSFQQREGYSTLDWSSDGALVAVGSWDHQAYIHDGTTGALRHVLRGHLGAITDVSFSHNGHWLATLSFDDSLRLWDVSSGLCLALREGSDIPVEFSTDDRFLAASLNDGTMGLVEIAPPVGFRELHPAQALDRPWSLATNSYGSLIASGGDAGVQLWEAKTGREIPVPDGAAKEPARVLVSFGREPETLLASSRRDGLRRWLVAQNGDSATIGAAEKMPLDVSAAALPVGVSADGHYCGVVYPNEAKVSLVPLGSGEKRLDFAAAAPVYQLATSANGDWLASASRTHGGTRVWNVRNGTVACDIEQGEDTRVAFSSDSQWLVTGTARGYQFWRTGAWTKGSHISPEPGGLLTNFAVAVSPKGELVALQQPGDTIALHSARDATLLARLEPPRPLRLEHLAFTGDGEHLAALGANQVIQLWDIPALRHALQERGLDW